MKFKHNNFLLSYSVTLNLYYFFVLALLTCKCRNECQSRKRCSCKNSRQSSSISCHPGHSCGNIKHIYSMSLDLIHIIDDVDVVENEIWRTVVVFSYRVSIWICCFPQLNGWIIYTSQHSCLRHLQWNHKKVHLSNYYISLDNSFNYRLSTIYHQHVQQSSYKMTKKWLSTWCSLNAIPLKWITFMCRS